MESVQSSAKTACRSDSSRASVTSDPAGWITRSVPYRGLKGREPLAIHGGWPGPHKLVQRGRGFVRVSEVFVDPHVERDVSCFAEETDECARLIERLVQETLTPQGKLPLDNWQPPGAADLSDYLQISGHEPTTDEQENLRLTLKNRGCDGQIRLQRAPGRLRLTMQVGTWDALDETQEQAMLKLARCHNNRVRLVRIAWETEGSSRRCTAQIDLSGLPCHPDLAWFWSSILRMAIGGLELTLHQMGKELNVLADPRQEHLVAWLIGRRPVEAKSITRPGKPR